MEVLRLTWAWLASGFYSWALREISPLHPDLPRIVLRKQELDDRLKS